MDHRRLTVVASSYFERTNAGWSDELRTVVVYSPVPTQVYGLKAPDVLSSTSFPRQRVNDTARQISAFRGSFPLFRSGITIASFRGFGNYPYVQKVPVV